MNERIPTYKVVEIFAGVKPARITRTLDRISRIKREITRKQKKQK